MKRIKRSDYRGDGTVAIEAVQCDGEPAVRVDFGISSVVLTPAAAMRLFTSGARLAASMQQPARRASS